MTINEIIKNFKENSKKVKKIAINLNMSKNNPFEDTKLVWKKEG